jgi:large subunit ribosomal protein L25
MEEALEPTRRSALGKSSVKKLRFKGFVPAVVYGKGKENTPVQLEAETLRKYLEESGRMADLVLDGKRVKAVVKEVQHDIFTDDIIHVDFQLVSLAEKITLPVPVVLAGELSFPPDQGTLEQMLTEVQVECLPKDVPDEIEINISPLEPGVSVRVSDLEVPAGVAMVTSGEEMVVAVRMPTVEVEEVPVEEAEAEEPEVIGERKEEEKESR